MGQGNSQELFLQVLKTMLRSRGTKIGTGQLEKFLQFIEKVCPWFPEEGTVNVETWARVGKKLQDHYAAHGPQEVPVDAFALWTLIRDCLDPRHEGHKILGPKEGQEEKAVNSNPGGLPPVAPSAPPLPVKGAVVVGVEKPGFSESFDEFNPSDQEDLDEAAARYHSEDDFIMLAEKPPPHGKAQEREVDHLKQRLEELTRQVQQLSSQGGPSRTKGPTPAPSVIAGLEGPPLVEVIGATPEERVMVAIAEAGPGGRNDPGWQPLRIPTKERDLPWSSGLNPPAVSPLQAALQKAQGVEGERGSLWLVVIGWLWGTTALFERSLTTSN